jgi:hypothetical protein
LKQLKVPAISIAQDGKNNILALVRQNENVLLVSLSNDFSAMRILASFPGSNGRILIAEGERLLFSIDNTLYLSKDKSYLPVLKASNTTNFFWHSTILNGKVILQEYGPKGPTMIFSSRDLLCWDQLLSNLNLDHHSKHFHNIVLDPFRNQLIATLGDGNLVRVVNSVDEGLSWQPLYSGAWQFVPVVPMKDSVVFGMDSAIATGGLAIYYPKKDCWKFVFLKWQSKKVKFSQMCDLKRLATGLWVASLGTPEAILVSRDLVNWHKLFLGKFNEGFNHCMQIYELPMGIICCTGKEILKFENPDLEEVISNTEPVLISYNPWQNRIKEFFFVKKRRLIQALE